VILDRHTSKEELMQATEIVAYHSCSFNGDFLSRINNRPDKNIHAGSFFQAAWRADYKVNDNEDYPVAYIYELVLAPKKICPELLPDSGYDVDQSEEDKFKPEYDLLVYHNTGEGYSHENNLSVIILDPKIIKSVKLYRSMNGEQITSSRLFS
jgi:hypothetical protein